MSGLAEGWKTEGQQWIRVRLCDRCGRPLTTAKSVSLGVGPKCARRDTSS
ncbi:DUF6011 domain-containing protein [Tsukamurella sp. USMM236]